LRLHLSELHHGFGLLFLGFSFGIEMVDLTQVQLALPKACNLFFLALFGIGILLLEGCRSGS
jgi:hypothetical protein